MLTGVALVAAYAMLGATWLVMKTDHDLRATAQRLAWVPGAATLALVALVSLITPFLDPVYMDRWFAFPNVAFTALVPAAILIAAFIFVKGLREGRDTWPFRSALALFVLGFVGLGISSYPFMVPPSLTIWQAAAPDESLLFLLVGAVVLIPMILGYTAYACWVFRGKTDPDAGYH